MLLNYAGSAAYIIMAWTVGLAILKISGLEKAEYKSLPYLSIPVGTTVSAIISALIYLMLGQAVMVIRIAYGILFIAALIFLIYKKTKKQEFLSLIVIIGIFLIMSIPGLLKGEKLYVHKGNIYDHYFYVSEVIYMCQHPFKYGVDLFSKGALPDVLEYGFWTIKNDRPTTPLLCAVLAGKSWGSIFFQTYLFNMLNLSSAIGSMFFAIELLSSGYKKKRNEIIGFLLAVIYIFGFYGQIQYDINAWPQQTCLACLIAYICIFAVTVKELKDNKFYIPRWLLLMIMGGGMFLIYPENTFVHGAILIASTLMIVAMGRFKVKLSTVFMLIAVPIGILLVVAAADWDTFRFSLTQVASGESEVRQSWAGYFNQYWYGYFPFYDSSSYPVHIIKRFLALVPAIAGMYFIAPFYGAESKILLLLWILLDFVISAGIIALIIRFALNPAGLIKEEKYEEKQFISCVLVLGLAFFAYYFLKNKEWSAGKVLLYISPYIYLALISPIVRPINGEKLSVKKPLYLFVTITSFVFITAQTGFIGARIVNIFENENGTGYLGTYPSDQAPYLKETFDYDFDASVYKDKQVAVCIDDPWYQSYIEMCLSYEDIQYYSIPDYRFIYNSLREIQPELNDGDIIITE